MSGWISVQDELPDDGEVVLAFRPQVLVEDYTYKPLKVATFKRGKFDCLHKPSMWMRIQKPEAWSQDLYKRQAP